MFLLNFRTHRPRKAERQQNPGFAVLEIYKRKDIPSQHRSGRRPKAARPHRGNLQLVLLQADTKVGVTLAAGAAAVQHRRGSVAAGPVLQLPVFVLH